MIHRTPDGRQWRVVTVKMTPYAELVNVPPQKRLLTTDFRGMVPPINPQ